MKRVILPALALLIFTSCEPSKTNSGSNSDSSLSQQPIVSQCTENQALVDGKCVTPTTVSAPEIKLAKVMISDIHVGVPADHSYSHYWYYQYDPFEDINGDIVGVPVVVHIIYEKISATTCSTAFINLPLTCDEGSGNLYQGRVAIPNGSFCIRSIACADGYLPSDINLNQLSVSSSGLEGNALIFNMH